MGWFFQFLSSPGRSLIGLLCLVAGFVVLLVTFAHSPGALALLGGICGALVILVAFGLPLPIYLLLCTIAFVIIGVVALVQGVLQSGVLVVFALVAVLVTLMRFVLPRIRGASSGYRPGRSPGWSLPIRKRSRSGWHP